MPTLRCSFFLEYMGVHCPVLFAYDFVGLAETGSALERLIDIVDYYSEQWHFEASQRCVLLYLFSQVGKVSGR